MQTRKCGDCTACCEGWLHGEVHGQSFYKGKPCHFLGCNGCTIYPKRPKEPCVTYRCAWLDDPQFPEWMQPHLCKAIITKKTYKDRLPYLEVVECGEKLDSSVLSWLVLWTLNNKSQLHYQIQGGWNKIGFDQEFLNDPAL